MVSLSHNELKAIRNRDRNYPTKSLQKIASSEIEEQVKAFLASGGQIKQVPSGLSGDELLIPNVSPSMKMLETSGEGMSLRAVSIMLGRSHAWISKMIQQGKGPRFILDSKMHKRFDRDEVIRWNEQCKQK